MQPGGASEDRQLETAARLPAWLGWRAVVAVRLLQLRALRRTEPKRPALEIVPPWLVETVQQRLRLQPAIAELTIREFCHAVARLAGFIGRKSAGAPGWLTLWRGWEKLQDLCWGLETLPVN